jgi:uncharacterized protein
MLALALAMAGSVVVGSMYPAAAQEQERSSGGGLLRLLFGSSESRTREAPQATQPAQRAQPRAAQPRRSQARSQGVPAARQAVAAVEKSEDARKVLVVGDFVAGGLGEGLETAYGENADVVIVTRSSGSSGLVRDDYYDWPGTLGGILEAEEPDIVIVMIGANDRQQLVVDGRRQEPRSDPWMEEYEARIRKMVDIVREHEAHLIWAGMIPFRFRSMSSDMIAFNDLYRRVTEEAGGEYVDVWDGFVDEEGNFATNGPDMNGQPAQLRAGDGINITRAGKRKIAFYVEKPLNRLLEGSSRPSLTSFGPLPLPDDLDSVSIDITEVERTQPISLNDPALLGPGELLGGRPGHGGHDAARPSPVEVGTPCRQGPAGPTIFGCADREGTATPNSDRASLPSARQQRRAHQRLVDGTSRLAALANRPYDERLASAHVTGGIEPVDAGAVVAIVGGDTLTERRSRLRSSADRQVRPSRRSPEHRQSRWR